MKYYYNGKLIRTSNHVYTHAVLTPDGKVIGCRNGLANAQRAKDAERGMANNDRRDAEAAIKALRAGRSFYFYHVGRMQYKHTFTAADTVEKYERIIRWAEAVNAEVDTYIIVELEAR